jgi:hypothetical protein
MPTAARMRQPGGAAPARAGVGSATRGRRRGVQPGTARLVSWRRIISGGIAGANARDDRGRALRGRAGADGGTNHSGGIETAAMERGYSQEATQGGSGKGGFSGPAAGGDYDDGGLNRRTPRDGQSGLPESLALSPEEIRAGSSHYQEPTPKLPRLTRIPPLPLLIAPIKVRARLASRSNERESTGFHLNAAGKC